MTTPKHQKLTLRDFTFVYDKEIGGQTYQNGPFLILVGRNTYSCTYKGQTFSWGHESILSAVEACEKRDRDIRRKLIPSLY
jgi:hypothetical protein